MVTLQKPASFESLSKIFVTFDSAMVINFTPEVFIENNFSASHAMASIFNNYVETTDGDFCGPYLIDVSNQSGSTLDEDVFTYDISTKVLTVQTDDNEKAGTYAISYNVVLSNYPAA